MNIFVFMKNKNGGIRFLCLLAHFNELSYVIIYRTRARYSATGRAYFAGSNSVKFVGVSPRVEGVSGDGTPYHYGRSGRSSQREEGVQDFVSCCIGIFSRLMFVFLF